MWGLQLCKPAIFVVLFTIGLLLVEPSCDCPWVNKATLKNMGIFTTLFDYALMIWLEENIPSGYSYFIGYTTHGMQLNSFMINLNHFTLQVFQRFVTLISTLRMICMPTCISRPSSKQMGLGGMHGWSILVQTIPMHYIQPIFMKISRINVSVLYWWYC